MRISKSIATSNAERETRGSASVCHNAPDPGVVQGLVMGKVLPGSLGWKVEGKAYQTPVVGGAGCVTGGRRERKSLCSGHQE